MMQVIPGHYVSIQSRGNRENGVKTTLFSSFPPVQEVENATPLGLSRSSRLDGRCGIASGGCEPACGIWDSAKIDCA
jgi:hypothetical protein